MTGPVLDLVLRQAARWPDRAAHEVGSRSLSYRELVEAAARLGRRLRDHLADDRSPVILVGHKEPEMLVGFLGCLLAGHPYVPIDSSAPASRLAQIVDQSGSGLCLTVDRIAQWVAESGPAVLDPAPASSADLAYVMFTSGSTGEPKGVPITRGNLGQFVDWMRTEQRFEEGGERFLNQAIFGFDLSVMDTWLSLATGGTLVSLTKDDIGDPRRLFQVLGASQVTTWVSTPTFAQLCLAERRFDRTMLPAVRRFLFCGERLGGEVAGALLDRFPDAQVWNTYGPTEATVATTSIRIDRALLSRHPTLPIGRAASGTRVDIRTAGALGTDQQGEIVIGGPNVSPGYLGRSDLTERAFGKIDGLWSYRTGDLGHVADGLLFCDGRMDDQIKLNGYRIELGDVEANLAALPGITGAAVVPTSKGAQSWLTGFVTVDPSHPGLDPAALKAALAERLPGYMVPRRIRFIATLPMTPNGKVDRRSLAALAG